MVILPGLTLLHACPPHAGREKTIQRRFLFHIQFMCNVPGAITHVSDTALLVAGCRAIETERPDALVRDPFVARLAGDRGIAMFRTLPHPEIMAFGMAIRTRFIDELILDALASTALATVVSFGSGLDTRPWRLNLPPDLRWIEVDFPAVLDYKDELLAAETPLCRRERLPVDLNDPAQRARVYAAVGRSPTLMLTEGLLMYLPAQTVRSLASEPPRESGIAHWICDIVTSSFTQAIGGGGTRVVRHVMADDHLAGEQILQTLYSHGWQTAVRRSYITDLSFASERIRQMAAGAPSPPKTPPFEPGDPTGVHHFVRSSSTFGE
jgi:methyltransferase (TIGR00027 family)